DRQSRLAVRQAQPRLDHLRRRPALLLRRTRRHRRPHRSKLQRMDRARPVQDSEDAEAGQRLDASRRGEWAAVPARSRVAVLLRRQSELDCNLQFAIADDWPQFRGPNRDDVSKETGLLKQWPKEG